MNNLPEDATDPQSDATLPQHAGGAILLRPHDLGWQFLLLRHADRWDLPKGLVEPGESPIEAAHRELWEETGIDPTTVQWVPDFLFTHRYNFTDRSGRPTRKQLTVFLGVIRHNPEIRLTEHVSFQWFDWAPPHQIEPKNVDGVLQAVADFGGPPTTGP